MSSDSLRDLIYTFGRNDTVAALSDAELLQRYVRQRDAAAFEVLVWRHGPMVRAACQRVLGPGPDADDAFQATFLVFVQKAAAVRQGNVLGAWLHRVAVRAAMRLRVRRARLKQREGRPLTDVGATSPPVSEPDVLCSLDAEIDRLPDRFRRVVVLCWLHGRSAAEAAVQLGCPRGTVLSRLATARQRLRARLLRRGIVPAAVTAVVTADSVGAAVLSADLVNVTVALSPGSGVRSQISTLSRGVMQHMFLQKMKPFLYGSVALVLTLGLGAGVFFSGRGKPASAVVAADPPQPPKPANQPIKLEFKVLKPEPADDELRRLQIDRHNAAMKWYRDFEARQDIDLELPTTLEQMLSALRAWQDASLELAKPPEEIAVRERFLAYAKLFEDKVSERARVGLQKPRDDERTKHFRLELEIQLLKAKKKRPV